MSSPETRTPQIETPTHMLSNLDFIINKIPAYTDKEEKIDTSEVQDLLTPDKLTDPNDKRTWEQMSEEDKEKARATLLGISKVYPVKGDLSLEEVITRARRDEFMQFLTQAINLPSYAKMGLQQETKKHGFENMQEAEEFFTISDEDQKVIDELYKKFEKPDDDPIVQRSNKSKAKNSFMAFVYFNKLYPSGEPRNKAISRLGLPKDLQYFDRSSVGNRTVEESMRAYSKISQF